MARLEYMLAPHMAHPTMTVFYRKLALALNYLKPCAPKSTKRLDDLIRLCFAYVDNAGNMDSGEHRQAFIRLINDYHHFVLMQPTEDQQRPAYIDVNEILHEISAAIDKLPSALPK